MIWVTLLRILLFLCSLFLILIVLIQRGKGGGLAGAFGGMGGHSAFGTRAGDKLMRVTIVVASVWIGLAILLVLMTKDVGETSRFAGAAEPAAMPSRMTTPVPSDASSSSSGGRELTLPATDSPDGSSDTQDSGSF